MSLVNRVRTGCVSSPADHRRYADLLRSDNPKDADELKSLMIKLRKTADDLYTDRKVVNDVTQLQSVIAAGRNTDSPIAELIGQIQGHDAETLRINDERKSQAKPLHERRAALVNAKGDAEAAVGSLAALKSANPELLADIAVPDLSELG